MLVLESKPSACESVCATQPRSSFRNCRIPPLKWKKKSQAQEYSSGQMCLNPQLSLVAVQAQEFKPSAYLQPTPAESLLCRYSHEGPMDSHPTIAGRIKKPGLCRCCCILLLWFLYHQKMRKFSRDTTRFPQRPRE